MPFQLLQPGPRPAADPPPTSDLLAFYNVRRLHGYATSAPKSDYTANVPGDARLFAGPATAGGSGGAPGAGAAPSTTTTTTSGPLTAIGPLAAARAGLGPPVPGVASTASGHLDVAGLRAALGAGLGNGGGGGGGLTEADKGAVLGGGQ